MASGSLWNYYGDEIDEVDGKSFKHKTKIVEKTAQRPQRPGNEGNPNREDQPPILPLNTEVVFPLKHLSNFGRSLDLPLINSEIELNLKRTKNSVLIEEDNNLIGVSFIITSTKLYVLVITLSINDNIKFLENIKQGFKRTIPLNKYRSEITKQPKNNNLDYLIDPTFRNINRLFVLSFKSGNNDPAVNSFHKYYMPLVEIKYFNALIDFLISQSKTNKKHMKNLSKCQEIMTIQQGIY